MLEPQGEGIAWQRGNANPFAAQVNTTNKYNAIEIWNTWIQEDWQAGVGRVDPEAGGFLYAEAETRVPNQVILPPLVQVADLRVVDGTKQDCRYMPDDAAGSITVGFGTYTRVAMAMGTPSTFVGTDGYLRVAFYASIPDGETATISIYSNSATAAVHSLPLLLSSTEGKPGTLITSTAVDGMMPDKGFYWYAVSLLFTATASTQYWVTIEPTVATDTIEVVYGSSGYNALAKSFSAGTWSTLTGKYLWFLTDAHRLVEVEGASGYFVRFNSQLYWAADERLFKFDSTNNCYTLVGTITGTGFITSMVVFGPKIYFARSASNYTTMNTSEVFAAAATTASIFLDYNDTLYRAYQNDLYYLDTDLVTWVGPFTVGGDSAEIRGMAGMGDSLYLATDKALFRFAPGNVVEETTRFGAEDTLNGQGMIEYQGKLYIPSAGRIFRFDPSGQMMDVWVNKDDDLPFMRLGKISHLTRMNNWLVAYVLPTDIPCHPTLWIYQEEGWHFLATATSRFVVGEVENFTAYYDRGTSRLWFSHANVWPMYVDIEDYALNPYNSDTYLYQPYGWVEQARFFGGEYFLTKNFDGVTVAGDNISSSQCVDMFYQDIDSTGWMLLGTITEDGQELRWPTISISETFNWIRLAARLRTTDGDETPRLRSIVVKFFPNVNDRFVDSVTLTLKDYIEMPDGALDTHTMAEQYAHISGLTVVRADGNVIYQDPLGTQYEVVVKSHNTIATKFAYYNSANQIKELRVSLVLEQVTHDSYTP